MTYDVPQTTNAVDSVEDVCSQYSQAFWLVTKQVWQNLSNAWSEFYKQIRYVTLRIIDVLRNSFDVLRNLFAIVIVCFSRKNCVLLSINCVLLSSSAPYIEWWIIRVIIWWSEFFSGVRPVTVQTLLHKHLIQSQPFGKVIPRYPFGQIARPFDQMVQPFGQMVEKRLNIFISVAVIVTDSHM